MDSNQSLSADFYIATDGCDDGSGTFEEPFATFNRAKLAVYQRAKKNQISRFLWLCEVARITWNSRLSSAPQIWAHQKLRLLI